MKKIGKDLKKKVVMFTMAGAMALTGVAGMTGTAEAKDPATYPNYYDTDYSFKSVSSVGYTECRLKTDTTKVYIHPTSGPNLYYRVLGTDIEDGSNAENKSNAHMVKQGVKASFTNWVREDNKKYARLKMRRSAYAAEYTRGVWSPDSSQNYVIFD